MVVVVEVVVELWLFDEYMTGMVYILVRYIVVVLKERNNVYLV